MMRLLGIIAATLVPFALLASEGYKLTEEVTVEGGRVIKQSWIDETRAKVVNQAPTGSTETIVDISADKVVMINHFNKSYQVAKLSDFIKFAEGIANGLKQGGFVNPEKLDPKIVFERKGTEKSGSWNAVRYLVKVDGREFYEIWVSPDLKDNPVNGYRKKFAAYLPESLVKYRDLEDKIKDQAAAEGMIVRMIRIPLNKKMPRTDQTVTAVEKVDMTPEVFAIPSDYTDKTIVDASQPQPQAAPQKKN